MEYPSVSVVIPAYNEEKTLPKLLSSVLKLDYPKKNFEIIVIDDGSIDRTPKILKRYPVKVIQGPHKGVGVARNIGWRAARNEIVIFIDADHIMNRPFIKEIVKAFEDPKVGGVDSRTELANKKSLIARMLFLRAELGVNEYNFPFAKAVRRKILKELDGIKAKYGYFDDWDFTMRVIKKGYKIVWAHKAVVWHQEPETLNELWRRHKWEGTSILFLFKDHKTITIRKLLFPLLTVFLPVYVLLLFASAPFNLLGILGLIIYLLVELRRSIKLFLITKQLESFLTPLFDTFSMSLFMIGILIGLLNIGTKPKA